MKTLVTKIITKKNYSKELIQLKQKNRIQLWATPSAWYYLTNASKKWTTIKRNKLRPAKKNFSRKRRLQFSFNRLQAINFIVRLQFLPSVYCEQTPSSLVGLLSDYSRAARSSLLIYIVVDGHNYCTLCIIHSIIPFVVYLYVIHQHNQHYQ